MIDLERILWPTDFSEHALTAELYACSLAKQFGAELHIVHVVIDPAYMVSAMGAGYIPDSYHSDMESRSDEELARLPEDRLGDDLTVIRKTIGGAAAPAIIGYARDEAIDMIVMATHGYTGLTGLLLGSVTEKVVRTAPCPVLTVHAGDRQFVDED